MGANARLLAQLNTLEAQNAGKFFGQTFGPVTSAIGKAGGSAISNFFTPSINLSQGSPGMGGLPFA